MGEVVNFVKSSVAYLFLFLLVKTVRTSTKKCRSYNRKQSCTFYDPPCNHIQRHVMFSKKEVKRNVDSLHETKRKPDLVLHNFM